MLSEQVDSQSKSATEKLAALNITIKEANSTLTELKSVADFTLTVSAAENNDRGAFDKLRQIAEDYNNPFFPRAAQAWNKIFEEHSVPVYQSGFTVPWAEGFDPKTLALTDLVKVYQVAPAPLKPALLEYIWKRNDIPIIDKLDFLLSVMKSDASLTAVE